MILMKVTSYFTRVKKFQLANRDYLTVRIQAIFSSRDPEHSCVLCKYPLKTLLTIYQQTFVLKSHLHEGLLTSYLSTSLCQEEMLTQKLNIQLRFMADLEIRVKRAG